MKSKEEMVCPLCDIRISNWSFAVGRAGFIGGIACHTTGCPTQRNIILNFRKKEEEVGQQIACLAVSA